MPSTCPLNRPDVVSTTGGADVAPTPTPEKGAENPPLPLPPPQPASGIAISAPAVWMNRRRESGRIGESSGCAIVVLGSPIPQQAQRVGRCYE
ncbi:hypothetical protein D3C87_1983570 [compost metagenome]